MPYYLDRTSQFRALLEEDQTKMPSKKKPRISVSDSEKLDVALGKEYLTEAYNILKHINTLNDMLASIKRSYLDVNSKAISATSTSEVASGRLGTELSWNRSRPLTNQERDEIDLQARTILSRCANRVKEMEALEKRRSDIASNKSKSIARFLPTRLRSDYSSLSSDVVAAHRASISWYLNRRLTESSQSQKEMQEERVKLQIERNRTLGSSATQDALNFHSSPSYSKFESKSWFAQASLNLAKGASEVINNDSSNGKTLAHDPEPLDDDDDIELSESQIQQFEMENSEMLRSVQDTLESVQQAESQLLSISSLQMELMAHLTQQTELTEQLYEDAIATTSMVEKGNVQLKEARRRSKDSRLFILVFLIGASLSLLFLHYY